MLPHLKAAYRMARALMENECDVEDAVQEAYLRALRSFDGFKGENGRPWILAIVRNTCGTALERASRQAPAALESIHNSTVFDPEHCLLKQADIDSLHACIELLPVRYREVIILRELEESSYREISGATSVPIGTVMSRLARARTRLLHCLMARGAKGFVCGVPSGMRTRRTPPPL
jgi:RNA polymerase sigma-70 factor, ECF subfamily